MAGSEKEPLIPMDVLENAAPIIRNAAHPLRLRILDFLRFEGEPRNVSQIIAATGAEQAVVSQQLRVLKDQGILSSRREGNYVLYEICNRSVLHLLDCIRSHQNC